MPKAPKGFHKCADGKTIRPLRPPKGPINPRAKEVGSQRMRSKRRRQRERERHGSGPWTGTGSRHYRSMNWWGKLFYRIRRYFSERARNRQRHKALYKKAGQIKPSSQYTIRPIARREQHK